MAPVHAGPAAPPDDPDSLSPWLQLVTRVLEQAALDLQTVEHRAAAATFLSDTLWHPACVWRPWIVAMGLRRRTVLAHVEACLAQPTIEVSPSWHGKTARKERDIRRRTHPGASG